MKTYLVGGAIRDKLLKRKIKERDWVVVGSTPHDMLKRGFRKVGRDFPVFLHPQTHEEYALARTERKTGKGYTQFQCYFDPSVTLEEDLMRRDLTINAIAQTPEGKLIDPYNGIKDLKQKVLRHVSSAFAEDPVRILRVARFAARFGDFKVHPTTNKLMRQMLRAGEVDALVPERVWQELERALNEDFPDKFFLVLKKCGALKKLFPAIARNFTLAIIRLKKAAKISKNNYLRFAALFSSASPLAFKKFCVRYRIPNKYRELTLLVINYKKYFRLALKLTSIQLLNFLTMVDVFRRPERFLQLLDVLVIIDPNCTAQKKYLLQAYKKTMKITGKTLLAQKIPAAQIPAVLRRLRLKTLQKNS